MRLSRLPATVVGFLRDCWGERIEIPRRSVDLRELRDTGGVPRVQSGQHRERAEVAAVKGLAEPSKLRDVRAEQRSRELQEAVTDYTMAALRYGKGSTVEARRDLAIARTLVQREVRNYFFRVVLASIGKESDSSDFRLLKAAKQATRGTESRIA
jgi:hypothetical protein